MTLSEAFKSQSRLITSRSFAPHFFGFSSPSPQSEKLCVVLAREAEFEPWLSVIFVCCMCIGWWIMNGGQLVKAQQGQEITTLTPKRHRTFER